MTSADKNEGIANGYAVAATLLGLHTLYGKVPTWWASGVMAVCALAVFLISKRQRGAL